MSRNLSLAKVSSAPVPAVVRKQVLVVMCLALVLVVANVSMLNVALRDIGLDLEATATQQHWIVDSYAVAFAALLLPFGAIGDKFGRRSVMLAGLLLTALPRSEERRSVPGLGLQAQEGSSWRLLHGQPSFGPLLLFR